MCKNTQEQAFCPEEPEVMIKSSEELAVELFEANLRTQESISLLIMGTVSALKETATEPEELLENLAYVLEEINVANNANLDLLNGIALDEELYYAELDEFEDYLELLNGDILLLKTAEGEEFEFEIMCDIVQPVYVYLEDGKFLDIQKENGDLVCVEVLDVIYSPEDLCGDGGVEVVLAEDEVAAKVLEEASKEDAEEITEVAENTPVEKQVIEGENETKEVVE